MNHSTRPAVPPSWLALGLGTLLVACGGSGPSAGGGPSNGGGVSNDAGPGTGGSRSDDAGPSNGGTSNDGGTIGSTPPTGPSIQSFAATRSAVFVGERGQLLALFSGGSGEVAGIGSVESGAPVDTPVLTTTTEFTLTVRGEGQVIQATVSVAAGYRDRLRPLANASVGRSRHLAIAQADGSALLMGGYASESTSIPDSTTSEAFDPIAERFTAGPDLAFSALDGQDTVVLPQRTGFLLAGGGPNSGPSVGGPSSLLSQTFDPVAQRFVRSGNLQLDHSGTGSGTALGDGRALITGGGTPAIRGAEVYDPDRRAWTEVSPMGVGRRSHTATLLNDGRVLIAGGLTCCTSDGQNFRETYTSSAELFDPATGRFTPTGSLGVARGFHQATLLSDGRVLISGGTGELSASDPPDLLARTEIYDPATGTFTPAGNLQVARVLHVAVLLSDGRVLDVGGVKASLRDPAAISLTELFDPRTGQWTQGPTLTPAWSGLTATRLGNGKVLLFGGEDAAGNPQPTALLFE
jgi:hypothetical protein